MPHALVQTENLPSLKRFFEPGGVLAQSSLNYEQRKGQYEMARAVEDALQSKRHLIVEAGTGTGKNPASSHNGSDGATGSPGQGGISS